MISIRRTIETIFDAETGQLLEAEQLFKNSRENEARIFQWRTEIERQLQAKAARYLCLYCKQPVALRGRNNITGRTFYFTHPYDSADCPIKTGCRLSEEQVRRMKYNGEKESVLHEHLKNALAQALRSDEQVSDVRVEKVYKDQRISGDWKKPDVMAAFLGKKVAFELQLSTTFLSVIVSRSDFYRQRGVFLIWIFPNFSIREDLQKFTQKDVYYNNSFNVYVFDKEAQRLSEAGKSLVLRCFYREFSLKKGKIEGSWASKYIKLSDLHFDTEETKVCFYDSALEKNRLERLLEQERAEGEENRRKKLTEDKVRKAVEYLRALYINDWLPFKKEGCPLNQIESREEIAQLDQKLRFSSENAHIIGELFVADSKPRFLQFICMQDSVQVDLSSYRHNGNSVFECVAHCDQQHLFYRLMPLLIRKGYDLSERDRSALEKLYTKNFGNATEYEKKYMERWAFTTSLTAIWSHRDALLLEPIKKVLFALFSLKHELIIGSRFYNFRQLTMNILEYYKEHGQIYLRGMKVYRQYDKQLREDKSGRLRAKINRFLKEKPIQDTSANVLLCQVLPELS